MLDGRQQEKDVPKRPTDKGPLQHPPTPEEQKGNDGQADQGGEGRSSTVTQREHLVAAYQDSGVELLV